MTQDIDHKEKGMLSMAQALKRLSWGVFALALINVFLVAALLGPRFMERRSFRPMMLGAPHGEMMLEGMARVLTPEDATTLRALYKEGAVPLREAQEGVRTSMEKLMDVFEDEKTDPAVIRGALDRLKQSHQNVETSLSNLIEQSYLKLSPEGRRRLSMMKPERMGRAFGRHQGGEGDRVGRTQNRGESGFPVLPPPPLMGDDRPAETDGPRN